MCVITKLESAITQSLHPISVRLSHPKLNNQGKIKVKEERQRDKPTNNVKKYILNDIFGCHYDRPLIKNMIK